jgi:hypothetical protein
MLGLGDWLPFVVFGAFCSVACTESLSCLLLLLLVARHGWLRIVALVFHQNCLDY